MSPRPDISELLKMQIGFLPVRAAHSLISFNNKGSDACLPGCRFPATAPEAARAVQRRQTLRALFAGLAVLSLPALAQPQRRVRRIGFFSATTAQATAGWLAGFREGMAELGWVEGRDYVIDARHGRGAGRTLPGLAAELIATQPDLLFAPGDEAVRALAERTKTIPIVFAIAADPVGAGFAASLRRPGGNVTGLTTLARDLGAKRLQLLREAFPRTAHVAVFYVPVDVTGTSQVREIEEAASRLGVRVSPIELRRAADIDSAFKRGEALGAHAYMMTSGFVISNERKAIVDRVLRAKVPAIFAGEVYAEIGGLMSYAPSYRDNFRRAAAYVDRIFKGARPGDLPIEQPVKFELIVNLKTAKAMGITFPQSFLVRADRVIE